MKAIRGITSSLALFYAIFFGIFLLAAIFGVITMIYTASSFANFPNKLEIMAISAVVLLMVGTAGVSHVLKQLF